MPTFTKKILTFIQKKHLVSPGQTILMGVSGGADSIALLHVLHELNMKLGVRLIVGHIDHQLRPEATADSIFVQQICRRLNLPCIIVRIRVKKIPKKSSLEERAREERQTALIALARRVHADTIALAHHRDDLAETVLMRLLRGSGLEGLQAILPERAIRGARFIRPLLNVSRKDIETFLKQGRIKFRRDATNRQTRFLRNKIRLKLLPLLECEYQPQIRQLLAKLAETAGTDYDFLDKNTQTVVKKHLPHAQKNGTMVWGLSLLKRLHPSTRRLVLRKSFGRLKGDTRQLSADHIGEIEDLIWNRPCGGVVDLPARIRVFKSQHQISFTARNPC